MTVSAMNVVIMISLWKFDLYKRKLNIAYGWFHVFITKSFDCAENFFSRSIDDKKGHVFYFQYDINIFRVIDFWIFWSQKIVFL